MNKPRNLIWRLDNNHLLLKRLRTRIREEVFAGIESELIIDGADIRLRDYITPDEIIDLVLDELETYGWEAPK